MACGFDRYALELSRRGYAVVGVDITPAYIADARATAQQEQLEVEFLQADVRSVSFQDEFDVVLNADAGGLLHKKLMPHAFPIPVEPGLAR